MGAVFLVVFSFLVLVGAYFVYGKFIAGRIFGEDRTSAVPSEELRDDVDYIPTNKEVVFGHHFASIAGTGPIVGPAIAVIWGWLPALVWILVGSIFAGAVHDYAALIMSVRYRGSSIGELSRKVVNDRVRTLFLFVIFFTLWIVVAIFGMVMAVIFEMYPQSVLPVWLQIPLAVTIGLCVYKKGANMTLLSLVAVAVMYFSIMVGVHFPFSMPHIAGLSPLSVWIIILFAYAFIASVLPVWSLLQPRDYINSHQLFIGLALITLGVFLTRPEIVAPAVQLAPKGAPPILPFLFITVACGAISGFHSLVSSGTSSKQVKNESDIRFVGYGGMLMEGFLAVLVVVSVAAGIGLYVKGDAGETLRGVAAWEYHYSSWTAAQGLTAKVTAFVDGAANMLKTIGIPLKYGQAVVGVLIASFVGTTLDTATRIQRYVVSEISSRYGVKPLENRYAATAFVVVAAAMLAFVQGGGKGALILWPLFGTSNQLLAGLVLLVAFVYLVKRGSAKWPVVLPMVFMMGTSAWAMLCNMTVFVETGKTYLAVIGGALILLEIWMIAEAVNCVRKTSFRTGV